MNNQKGFTLIEVLISITLLAFIMLGIMTTSENSIQTKDRVTKEDNKLLQVETALNRMQWDFEHAYSPLYFSIPMQANTQDEASLENYNRFMQKYQNNDRFSSVSYESLPIPQNKLDSKETFTFFTLANRRKFRDQRQSSFAWIRYDLTAPDSDDVKSLSDTKYLTRQFLADDVFNSDRIDWDKVKKQVLLKNVEAFQIQFWDYKTKKWKDSLREIKDGENIINAVKLTIQIKETNDYTKILEKIIRPLFPKFQSEDYYKLMNKKESEFLSGANANTGDQFNEFQ